MIYPNASTLYLTKLKEVCSGSPVKARDMDTLEILGLSGSFDMNYPVVGVVSRNLNYKFMAAEALWVLRGQNEVSPLSQHVERVAEYSDNGHVFYGAYGPNFVEQAPWVASQLRQDLSTRRAVLTLWKQRPLESKDIPCTVAMVFQVRDLKLHTHVFMRSSDVYLGLPYDLFTFTMMSAQILQMTRQPAVTLGALHYTAASGHVYQRDLHKADNVLVLPTADARPAMPNPSDPDGWAVIMSTLEARSQGRTENTGWVI